MNEMIDKRSATECLTSEFWVIRVSTKKSGRLKNTLLRYDSQLITHLSFFFMWNLELIAIFSFLSVIFKLHWVGEVINYKIINFYFKIYNLIELTLESLDRINFDFDILYTGCG